MNLIPGGKWSRKLAWHGGEDFLHGSDSERGHQEVTGGLYHLKLVSNEEWDKPCEVWTNPVSCVSVLPRFSLGQKNVGSLGNSNLLLILLSHRKSRDFA